MPGLSGGGGGWSASGAAATGECAAGIAWVGVYGAAGVNLGAGGVYNGDEAAAATGALGATGTGAGAGAGAGASGTPCGMWPPGGTGTGSRLLPGAMWRAACFAWMSQYSLSLMLKYPMFFREVPQVAQRKHSACRARSLMRTNTPTMSLPQSAHVLGAPTEVLGWPAGGAGAVFGASTWRRLTKGDGVGLLAAATGEGPPGAGLLLPPLEKSFGCLSSSRTMR